MGSYQWFYLVIAIAQAGRCRASRQGHWYWVMLLSPLPDGQFRADIADRDTRLGYESMPHRPEIAATLRPKISSCPQPWLPQRTFPQAAPVPRADNFDTEQFH